MERYFTVVKRPASQTSSQLKPVDEAECSSSTSGKQIRPTFKPSSSFHPHASSSLNKVLLSTLGDECNPITHSDLVDRSDRVISTSTGHQIAEDTMSRKRYFNEREAALSIQHRPSNPTATTTGIFHGTRIYINGYLEATTDIEIKRLVAEGGGKILFTPSRSTHILTSQGLSGSKTHKYLKTLRSTKPYVVKPEWVLDSIAAGRRRSERSYVVKMDQTLKDFMRNE